MMHHSVCRPPGFYELIQSLAFPPGRKSYFLSLVTDAETGYGRLRAQVSGRDEV